MSGTEELCRAALSAPGVLRPAAPGPGESVVVARWVHPRGFAVVLLLRRPRGRGPLCGDVDLAVREPHGWTMQGLYAGSLGYHDFFADPVPEQGHRLLGRGEALLHHGDLHTRVGYLELAVGQAITRVTSHGPDGHQDHEISTARAVLVGAPGPGPVTVTLYTKTHKTTQEHFTIPEDPTPCHE